MSFRVKNIEPTAFEEATAYGRALQRKAAGEATVPEVEEDPNVDMTGELPPRPARFEPTHRRIKRDALRELARREAQGLTDLDLPIERTEEGLTVDAIHRSARLMQRKKEAARADRTTVVKPKMRCL